MNRTKVSRPFGYWKSAAILFVLGLIGVLSLYPTLDPVVDALIASKNPPPFGRDGLKLVLLINPIILLTAGVLVGTATAPRIGFQSHLLSKDGGAALKKLVRDISPAVIAGLATATLTIFFDEITRPMLGASATELNSLAQSEPRTFWVTLSGMLYGGITEELMLRWGVLSFLAWLIFRMSGPVTGRPKSWVFWIAILASALLFGTAHLGVVDAQIGLTPPLVIRTLVLNGIAGVVFGLLFWKRSLEAAMIAHAVAHVGLTIGDIALSA